MLVAFLVVALGLVVLVAAYQSGRAGELDVSLGDALARCAELRDRHDALVDRVFGAAGIRPAAPEPPAAAPAPLLDSYLSPLLEDWVQQWEDEAVQARWRRKILVLVSAGKADGDILRLLEEPRYEPPAVAELDRGGMAVVAE